MFEKLDVLALYIGDVCYDVLPQNYTSSRLAADASVCTTGESIALLCTAKDVWRIMFLA